VKFFPHFGIGEKNEPVNVSERRQNPAALVEVTKDGKASTRWVFAKFPDFAFHDEPDLPVPVQLDCPQEKQGTTPDFAIVTIGRETHEVWARYRDETSSREVSTDEPVEVAGSQYEFHLAEFVPAGVLSENYERADGMGTVSVIQVEATHPEDGRRESFWLELTKEKFLRTPRGALSVLFHLSTADGSGPAHGAHQ
jgi:hypothetical protein